MATLTPHAFVQKWRNTTLTESAAYVSHFNDLCALVGHPAPTDTDKHGTAFTFQAGVTKQSGKQGWADVWKRGFFAVEYKGTHGDLNKAYQQLLQYREALENPPLLIVSDLQQLVIHTNFTNTVKQVYTLTLDDLLTSAGLKRLRDIFENPDAFKAPQTPAQVTKQAAEQFSSLAKLLRKWGEDPQRTAHFLIRLLFCLFAEDIDLLPRGLFSRLIERTRAKPAVFAQQLRLLFDAMANGGWFGSDEIRHFNGRLFDNADVLELDSQGLDILARVAKLDWSSIEPAILGTLFERSLDPNSRTQLGAHYTSREDILLIVEPVLMTPLRRRWQDVQAQARELASKRDAAGGSARTRSDADLRRMLVGFAGEVAGVRVLDPACGSGNFLYVALKALLDLEKDVITFASDIGAGSFFPSVSPEQLRGIELNEYAYELAQITVWIGYIQWLTDNGWGYNTLPVLQKLDTIKHMDAIVAFNTGDKPYEPEWPEADVVVGNPPFLGGKRLRKELGDSYVDAIFALYKGRVPHEADLVTYWFEKTRDLISKQQVSRAGLLSTQAIRAGASRKVLERIKTTGDIFYAQADRPWVLDGAAVRVSMVGFDGGLEKYKHLNISKNDAPEFALSNAALVSDINVNLTAGVQMSVAASLNENNSISFQGVIKVGPFDIDDTIAQNMLRFTGNPNNRPNSDVIKPWMIGEDVTDGNREMWIIDFGINISLEEAAMYEKPFEYVRKNVKPQRDQVRRKNHRERWWLFGESRPGMRKAIAQYNRYIITPAVAKHRIFVWVDSNVLVAQRLCVIARDDDYFFGVLHSKSHELWALATGSVHGDGSEGGRPVYNNTTCFETFPFPWPPGHEPAGDPRVEAIAAAARDLVEKRDRWLNPPGASEAELKKRTLTNLYNERPTWLDLAHKKLDTAVCAAYGWPADLADDQILERLLALNLQRAATQGSAPAAPAGDTDDSKE